MYNIFDNKGTAYALRIRMVSRTLIIKNIT